MDMETMYFIHSKKDIKEFIKKTKEFLDINSEQISTIHVFCRSNFLYYLFILSLYCIIHVMFYNKDKEEYYKLFRINNRFTIKLYKVKRFSLYDIIIREVYDHINANIPKNGLYYDSTLNKAFYVDYSKRIDQSIFDNLPTSMIIIPGRLIKNEYESRKQRTEFEDVTVYDRIEINYKYRFSTFYIAGFAPLYIPKEIEEFRFNYINYINNEDKNFVITRKMFTDITIRMNSETMQIIEPIKFEDSKSKGFIIELRKPIYRIDKIIRRKI